MPLWVPSAGFESRTVAHHSACLAPIVQEGTSVVIITHATRGDIKGRTTGILSRLHAHHGLKEVTLLLPEDAPHGRDGYALEKSSAKAKKVAELLAPHSSSLLQAARDNRLVVAGRFAWNVLRRLGVELRTTLLDKRVLYPCHWMNRPLGKILATLASTLQEKAPTMEQLKVYVVEAHREALRARWARLSVEERRAYRQLRAAAYAALPPEEKERRAQTIAAAYAALPPEEKERRAQLACQQGLAFWRTRTAQEKLQRVSHCLAWRRSATHRRAWRRALTEARAKMDPATKALVLAAMRKGYREKMTPERQTLLGEKRRQAWTLDMREEARQRVLTRTDHAEQCRRNFAKARVVKQTNQVAISSKTATTCARKVADMISSMRMRVETNGGELTKAERRTMRERSSHYLKLEAAGKISLEACLQKTFTEGLDFSLKQGARVKSEKLKERHARARTAARDPNVTDRFSPQNAP